MVLSRNGHTSGIREILWSQASLWNPSGFCHVPSTPAGQLLLRNLAWKQNWKAFGVTEKPHSERVVSELQSLEWGYISIYDVFETLQTSHSWNSILWKAKWHRAGVSPISLIQWSIQFIIKSTSPPPKYNLKTPIILYSHCLSVQFSHSVVSYSLRPHELQHARPPCPSPNPGVHPNPCPSSQWCHTTISSSVIPFSSCPQSFPASGSFPMSQLFPSGGQSIGVSASTSVLPMNTQDWFPLGWTGWLSLQSKGLSRVFSNTTVQKHQFFGAQLSSQSNSHIHTWPLEKP